MDVKLGDRSKASYKLKATNTRWYIGVSMARKHIVGFTTLCLMLCNSYLQSQEIQNVRLWKSPERTRVVLDLSENAKYQFFLLDSPPRAVIDCHVENNTKAIQGFRKASQTLDYASSAIKKIRSNFNKPGIYRIVLELNETIKPEHFLLLPNQSHGHRLVVDLKRKTPNHPTDPLLSLVAKQQAKPPVKRPEILRDLVIAIDAGHGGEDPGGIGYKGTKEKHIVLSVAKRLKNLIDREPGLKAALVRSGDYYIGLSQRRTIAKGKHNADLFVSLHADAWKKSSARGASVFVLSSNGATSTRARYLAEKENASDLIGGVVEVKDNPILKKVLVDLALNGSMEHSINAGQLVLKELGAITKLHKPHIEQAGFAVLKTAQMPSMLIELGFITNPREERLLKNSHHQKKLAKAVLRGIKRHFLNQPPPNTYFAALRAKDGFQHQIARGETISKIAEKYRIKTETLKSMNGLNSDIIHIGQVLRIPPFNP